eukprot:GHVS01084021.1.p1 GENE.GHVS01084021.1~~GHVS01084021.1.p1  ORF type:complete len:323 (-),score=74.24 GHVS01084021.1:1303-2271(-)
MPNDFKQRCLVRGCSAMSGEGLREGFEWLAHSEWIELQEQHNNNITDNITPQQPLLEQTNTSVSGGVAFASEVVVDEVRRQPSTVKVSSSGRSPRLGEQQIKQQRNREHEITRSSQKHQQHKNTAHCELWSTTTNAVDKPSGGRGGTTNMEHNQICSSSNIIDVLIPNSSVISNTSSIQNIVSSVHTDDKQQRNDYHHHHNSDTSSICTSGTTSHVPSNFPLSLSPLPPSCFDNISVTTTSTPVGCTSYHTQTLLPQTPGSSSSWVHPKTSNLLSGEIPSIPLPLFPPPVSAYHPTISVPAVPPTKWPQMTQSVVGGVHTDK